MDKLSRVLKICILVVLKIGCFWSADLDSADQQINMPSNAYSRFLWLRVQVHSFLLVQETEVLGFIFLELFMGITYLKS